MPVGRQIREVLDLHRPVEDPEGEVVRLLEEVGVREPALRALDYPHQLSGGMQQRILIAMAVAARPALLVADEPTTALDVTLQAQVLDLFRRLRDRTGTAVLLISHNLAVVARHADRIGVMYAGELVETGPAQAVLSDPRHPYTRGLVAAIPTLPPTGRPLPTIPGQVASIDPGAPGCRFATRCPLVVPSCHAEHPAMRGLGFHRQVRCPRVPCD
jgi:oligopeptide/dipeptide ABC transporter ATP-binding protein